MGLRLAAVVLTVAAATLAACQRAADPASPPDTGPTLVEGTHRVMGSDLRISVWTSAGSTARVAMDEANRRVDQLDELLSVWKPGSPVVAINAAAGVKPVPAGPEVREVLHRAAQYSEYTGGKFDVTFGVLSGLWRFDAQNEDDKLPDMAEVRRRLPLVDYRQIQIDDTAGTVFLRRPGMSIHLGGIGKGYAVDQAARILHRAGLNDFLIQFGGDMYAAGHKDGRPWNLGIRDPRGPETRIFASVALSDATFSTSGDYERFFMANGRRYHHIIDPTTGEPARGARSVTIVARQAVDADALSTGVFLMGAVEGMALVERLPDVEAVIVSDRNEVLVSSGLKGQVTLVAQPTDAP